VSRKIGIALSSDFGEQQAEKTAREEAKKKHKTVGTGGKKAADTAPSTESPTVSKTEEESPLRTPGLFDQQSRPATGDSTDATAQVIEQAD